MLMTTVCTLVPQPYRDYGTIGVYLKITKLQNLKIFMVLTFDFRLPR